ncbi:oligosaccharide repeat unit polymerase [Salinibacter ruber]|uniref:oligosaccharide repeat unit polymerase n=1 Tax=Salinibacter ruber TaxID=146919 RepID=UPI001ED96082|nr:oligosaccharide repeat unit polymerase [Salinibacter ruber]
MSIFPALTINDEKLLILYICSVSVLGLIVSPIYIKPDYDVFEAHSFVLLSVVIGVILRGIWISLFQTDSVNEFLGSISVTDVLSAYPLVFSGLIAYLLGYYTKIKNVRVPFKFSNPAIWSRRYLIGISVVVIVISGWVSYKLFDLNTLLFTTLEEVSSKRRTFVGGEKWQYTSSGYMRWAAGLVTYMYVIYAAYYFYKDKSLWSVDSLLLVVLFLFSTGYYFVLSSRGGVISLIIYTIIIYHFLQKRISVRAVVTGLSISVILFAFMTILRDPTLSTRNIAHSLYKETDKIILNENMFGIKKTAKIYKEVPENMNYMYGSTMVRWVYAPIPRSMWPSKPIISIGKTINRKVYGNNNLSGVPPTIMMEGYINFSFMGAIIVMYMLGLMVNYTNLTLLVPNSPVHIIFFTFVGTKLGLGLVGGDLSRFIVGTLKDMISLSLLLSFVIKSPIQIKSRR